MLRDFDGHAMRIVEGGAIAAKRIVSVAFVAHRAIPCSFDGSASVASKKLAGPDMPFTLLEAII